MESEFGHSIYSTQRASTDAGVRHLSVRIYVTQCSSGLWVRVVAFCPLDHCQICIHDCILPSLHV